MLARVRLLALTVLFACGDDPTVVPPDARVDAASRDAAAPDAPDAPSPPDAALDAPPDAPAPPDAAPDAPTTPDAASPPDAGGIDEDGCRILTLGPPAFQRNFFNQLTGARFPVLPPLGGDGPDHLLVELYDSSTPGLPRLEPGTFDLAAAPNDNLATCQHCVWVWVDASDGPVTDLYMATKGTLDLDAVVDPLDTSFAGATSRVVLARATLDEEGRSAPVPGGGCVS